jgi:hypothetical protein
MMQLHRQKIAAGPLIAKAAADRQHNRSIWTISSVMFPFSLTIFTRQR